MMAPQNGPLQVSIQRVSENNSLEGKDREASSQRDKLNAVLLEEGSKNLPTVEHEGERHTLH